MSDVVKDEARIRYRAKRRDFCVVRTRGLEYKRREQCGIGTLGQAMTSGRPILAVPFANDQPDNAYRVQRLGIARVLYPPQYRMRRVAQELRRLLDDSEHKRAALKVAAKVCAEDGLAIAGDAIDKELQRTRRGCNDADRAGKRQA